MMKKRILIAGASGMIGSAILQQALLSQEVSEVISLVRKKSNNKDGKLKEIIVKDFLDYGGNPSLFENVDVAFYCIGVYTGQVPDAQFREITVDYTIAFVKQLKERSRNTRLCFLSGAGADRTEESKTAFALYKGIAENRIAETGLEYYSFRPGYIYPVLPRKEPNLMYRAMRIFYPLLKAFGDEYSITSTHLSKAIFLIGLKGHDEEILENKDIVAFVKRNSAE
jgi:uncharacterized protein YbjT (DUF2867 family)